MEIILKALIENWISVLYTAAIGAIGLAVKGLYKKFKAQQIKDEAIAKGMQALLRSQMIADYNHYMEKKYAPIYAKENFENCWQRYHSLGVNGVMNSIHEEFMALPTSLEE